MDVFRKILVFIALLICSQFEVIAQDNQPSVASYNCESPWTGSLTYSLLRQIVERCTVLGRIRSLDDLIPILPAEYRSNFTLAYQSRSPEAPSVDALHPRIVLFGRGARLVLAFTGDPARPSYQTMQVLEFSDDGSFHPHEIDFEQTQVNSNETNLSQVQPRTPHIVDNPQSCARCHGNDSHPIWDAYDLWPGFYGSVDDHIAADSPEGQNYRQFRNGPGATGRYAALIYPSGSTVSPYGEGLGPSLGFAPNLRLTKLFMQLNARRVARIIRSAPRYRNLRARLASGSLGCQPFSVPANRRATVEQTLRSHFDDKVRRHANSSPLRAPIPLELDSHYISGTLAVVGAADLLGIDASNWFTSLETGAPSYSSFDGAISLGTMLGTEILRDLATEYPDRFAPFMQVSTYPLEGYSAGSYDTRPQEAAQFLGLPGAALRLNPNERRRLCVALRTHRERQVTRARPNPQPMAVCSPNQNAAPIQPAVVDGTREISANTIGQVCARCHHQSSNPIPEIPFNNLTSLRSYLQTNPNAATQILERLGPSSDRPMPPGSNGEERARMRAAMQEYLNQLREHSDDH